MNILKIAWVPTILLVLPVLVVQLTGQTLAPGRAGGPPKQPGNGTDPDQITAGSKKLEHGPQLPSKYVPSLSAMPKGYNFSERTGVDRDRQGNVGIDKGGKDRGEKGNKDREEKGDIDYLRKLVSDFRPIKDAS
jgi:hypothetical protein